MVEGMTAVYEVGGRVRRAPDLGEDRGMSTGPVADDGETPTTEDQYYYDTGTGEVQRGRGSSWSHRMGPYPTREAAQKALETARQRSEAWDEEDRREHGE